MAYIHLFNKNGFMTLQPNGDFNINGVIIDITAGTPPRTTGPNL